MDKGRSLEDAYKRKRNKRNHANVLHPSSLKHRRHNKVNPKRKRTMCHASDHPVLRQGQSFRSMYSKLKFALGIISSYDENDPFSRKRNERKHRSTMVKSRSTRIAVRLKKKPNRRIIPSCAIAHIEDITRKSKYDSEQQVNTNVNDAILDQSNTSTEISGTGFQNGNLKTNLEEILNSPFENDMEYGKPSKQQKKTKTTSSYCYK